MTSRFSRTRAHSVDCVRGSRVRISDRRPARKGPRKPCPSVRRRPARALSRAAAGRALAGGLHRAVGPVGQFDRGRTAATGSTSACATSSSSTWTSILSRCRAFISIDDPLSFRGHMRDHFYDRLEPDLAPPLEHRLFPDPADIGGDGTGHRALRRRRRLLRRSRASWATSRSTIRRSFRIPWTSAAFARLPTRMVRLSRETLLINAVTAARGNVDRIPAGLRRSACARSSRLDISASTSTAIGKRHRAQTASRPRSRRRFQRRSSSSIRMRP